MIWTVVTSFVAASVAGAAARVVAVRTGAVDRPGALKPHGSPTPYLGGIALGAGIAAGVIVQPRAIPWQVGLALVGVWTIGLIDDVRTVPPAIRLLGQLGLGLLVAAGGVVARVLPIVGLRWVGTALVFAAAINGVNMVDGMDGLAGAAGVMSAAALAIIAAGSGAWAEVMAVALAASTAGFLLHNRPPARLFLGDNGAYLLAGALAVVVLSESGTWSRSLGGLTCLGVFDLDLSLSLVRRISGGVRLTGGDRGHLYDQLRSRGASYRRTLTTVLALHAALITAGIVIATLPAVAAFVATGLVWTAALGTLAVLGFVSPSRT
jgi:UDP-N-acetylmuramyl pentapeptide phosphotransferase/UDP-N-acetylglucosamine-1-phosphate transferase